MSNSKSLRRSNPSTSKSYSWRKKSMLMSSSWRNPNSESLIKGSNSKSWRKRPTSMWSNSKQKLNSTLTKKNNKLRMEEINIDKFIDKTDPDNKSIIIEDEDLTIDDVNKIIKKLQEDKTIKKLVLKKTNLTNEGVEIITNALAANSVSLNYLDLTDNKFNFRGMGFIANALVSNKTLEILIISQNSITQILCKSALFDIFIKLSENEDTKLYSLTFKINFHCLDYATDFKSDYYSKPTMTGIYKAIVVGPVKQVTESKKNKVPLKFFWDRYNIPNLIMLAWTI